MGKNIKKKVKRVFIRKDDGWEVIVKMKAIDYFTDEEIVGTMTELMNQKKSQEERISNETVKSIKSVIKHLQKEIDTLAPYYEESLRKAKQKEMKEEKKNGI